MLSERRDTLLLALSRGKQGYGLAWADLSSGRFLVNEVATEDALEAELARLQPAELLVPDEDGWPQSLREYPGLRRHLELDTRVDGDTKTTLLGVLDSTVTPMGGRLLRRWLHRPLRDRHILR